MDKFHLSFFAAAMLARVEPFTDIFGGVLRTMQLQAKRQEENQGLDSKWSSEIAEELVNYVGEATGRATIGNQKMLARMNLMIFTVDDEDGFVTSDSPGCLCIPGPPAQPHPFLGHAGVEFTLPLSPHHLALYTRRKGPDRYGLGTRELVNEANFRTINDCVKEFVSWKGTVRSEWLKPVPRDS